MIIRSARHCSPSTALGDMPQALSLERSIVSYPVLERARLEGLNILRKPKAFFKQTQLQEKRQSFQTSWQRSSKQVRSSRGKAAALSGQDDSTTEQSSWRPRFVTDDDSEEQRTEESSHPDLYTLEKAKTKFWGRIAVIILGAVLLSERVSGKGIVTALNMATGVPVWEIEPALGLLVGALLAAGIYPVLRRLGKRADMARDPEMAKTLAKEPKPTVGDSFQVATGRLACLVLAGTILAEATTGKGILALLNVETGVEITEIEAGLTFLLLLLFTEDMRSPE